MNTQLKQQPSRTDAPTNSAEGFTLDEATVQRLLELGISRRGFMSFCTGMASFMALPVSTLEKFAAAALSAAKPSVVYMSFQECTGCLESMVNSFAFKGGATIENLILNVISLDYQETLMAASGAQAEEQLLEMTAAGKQGYVLVVDGSIPAQWDNGYFISGGRSGVARFREAAQNAGVIVAVGTCASFGGLPQANPNPTGAVSIRQLMTNLGISKPLINVPGCPPIPEVITGVILYYLTNGMPALDSFRRPTMFYSDFVHDGCYRKPAFEQKYWAREFDESAARGGGCLFKSGCKGPVTHGPCATIKWNQGVSFPILTGHHCIGCTEPGFWETGFFTVLPETSH